MPGELFGPSISSVWVHNLCKWATHDYALKSIKNGYGIKWLKQKLKDGKISQNDFNRIRALRTLQMLTNKAKRQLDNSNTLLKSTLGKRRYSLLKIPFLKRMFMGTAIELRVAKLIQGNTALKSRFVHVGNTAGRGGMSVDFKGIGEFKGLEFDITTKAQYGTGIKFSKYGNKVLVPTYDGY